MPRDDDARSRFAGPAGIALSIVCFALALGLIGGAIAVLPLAFEVKAFLAGAALLLAIMFGFLAVLAFLVMRAGRNGPP